MNLGGWVSPGSRTFQCSHVRPFALPFAPSRSSVFSDPQVNPEEYPPWRRAAIRLCKSSGFYDWFMRNHRHKYYGLHFEDTFLETPDVTEALKRLPKDELSRRDDRMKLALVMYTNGDILSKEEAVKPDEDKPYLAPYLAMVVQERRDRENFTPK